MSWSCWKRTRLSSYPEAKLGRVDPLEPLDVAGAGLGEAFDRLLDPAGDPLVEVGHVT